MEKTMEKVSRRSFFGTAGSAVLPLTARAYSRIVGANDRIQVAQLGCGNRASGHRQMLKLSSQTDPNFEIRSVCDLWTVNREKAAASVQQFCESRPKTSKSSEELLADPQLDAGMIGTGDHQQARILARSSRHPVAGRPEALQSI